MTPTLHTIEAPVDDVDLVPDISFVGRVTWFSSDTAPIVEKIERAAQRANGKELSIDCVYSPPASSPADCRVLLRRHTSRTFAGLVVLASNNYPIGTCTCRFYPKGLGLALVGRWRDGGPCRDWIAELSPR